MSIGIDGLRSRTLIGRIFTGIGSTASKLGMHFACQYLRAFSTTRSFNTGRLPRKPRLFCVCRIEVFNPWTGPVCRYATQAYCNKAHRLVAKRYSTALELRKHKIAVNTVAPGVIVTNMSESSPR